MVAVFLFCWAPYALQSLCSIFGFAEVTWQSTVRWWRSTLFGWCESEKDIKTSYRQFWTFVTNTHIYILRAPFDAEGYTILFQKVPMFLSVTALQFAKSSILWNPVIYVLLNKSVRFKFNSRMILLECFSSIRHSSHSWLTHWDHTSQKNWIWKTKASLKQR